MGLNAVHDHFDETDIYRPSIRIQLQSNMCVICFYISKVAEYKCNPVTCSVNLIGSLDQAGKYSEVGFKM